MSCWEKIVKGKRERGKVGGVEKANGGESEGWWGGNKKDTAFIRYLWSSFIEKWFHVYCQFSGQSLLCL